MTKQDQVKQYQKYPDTASIEKKDRELWDSLKRGCFEYNKSLAKSISV